MKQILIVSICGYCISQDFIMISISRWFVLLFASVSAFTVMYILCIYSHVSTFVPSPKGLTSSAGYSLVLFDVATIQKCSRGNQICSVGLLQYHFTLPPGARAMV